MMRIDVTSGNSLEKGLISSIPGALNRDGIVGRFSA
jgi:hypothetical protein